VRSNYFFHYFFHYAQLLFAFGVMKKEAGQRRNEKRFAFGAYFFAEPFPAALGTGGSFGGRTKGRKTRRF
jgi:hypothetical protein